MPKPPLVVHRESFPGRPAFDTAVSRALLGRVARGEQGESLRLYTPDDVVAFSILDRARPGFPAAIAAARASGFDAALRLAGGRAAVFHRETLAFAWCIPDARARTGIQARFETIAGRIATAFQRLGIDARVGEIPGEYCPGEYSVNARGAIKLMGVGQRVVKDAVHVGGVIVVRDTQRVRDVLVPVYQALGLAFDPATAGSLEDEEPSVTRERAADALLEVFAESAELSPAPVEPGLLKDAEALEPEHRL